MPPAFNAKRIPGFRTAAQKERPADPNDLRACVEAAINVEIEPEAWKRGLAVEAVISELVPATLSGLGRVELAPAARTDWILDHLARSRCHELDAP